MKMKLAENNAYRSNLEIIILNKELSRCLREAPPEYDPELLPSTSGTAVSNVASSLAAQPVIDLSLSDDTENALLKSNSSTEAPNTENEQSLEVDPQLTESAEIREIQKIPLPSVETTSPAIPTPPPLPEGEISPRTQERYHLKPFSVILEEKAEEVKQRRRSKRTASSQIGSQEQKVRRLCSQKPACTKKQLTAKKPTIPKIKINIKSLTKVPSGVTEHITDAFKTKEEFLEKFKIVPRVTRQSEKLGSEIPQEKEVNILLLFY